MNLKVTLNCGIPVDFTGKLDEPFHFVGTFAYNYAHKALSGYIKRVAMADEAVKLLMSELRKNY